MCYPCWCRERARAFGHGYQGFFELLGKQIAQETKKLEEESVWLDRVKRRRKWREDFWQTLWDFTLAIVYAPFVFCGRILFPVLRWMSFVFGAFFFMIMMFLFCFQFVTACCYEMNYGVSRYYDEQGIIHDSVAGLFFVIHELQSNIFFGRNICNNPWIKSNVYRKREEILEQIEEDRIRILRESRRPGPPGICLADPPNQGGPQGFSIEN
jgi:hypothetical protein